MDAKEVPSVLKSEAKEVLTNVMCKVESKKVLIWRKKARYSKTVRQAEGWETLGYQ